VRPVKAQDTALFGNTAALFGVGWPAVSDIDLRLQDSVTAASMDAVSVATWLSAHRATLLDVKEQQHVERLRSQAIMCAAAQAVKFGSVNVLEAVFNRVANVFCLDGDETIVRDGKLLRFLLGQDPGSLLSGDVARVLSFFRAKQGFFEAQEAMAAMPRDLRQLTIYQQSALYESGKLITAQLSQPAVMYISKLFAALQDRLEQRANEVS
jgi:hypothetical protein